MAEKKKKQELITFKVDPSLAEAIRRVPNRSEFIRNAILAAMDSICPMCGGLGILTPDQRQHWEAFATEHSVSECEDCHALHLVCDVSETHPHFHSPK